MSSYHHKECLSREWDLCGVDKLDTFYEPVTAEHANGEHEVTWSYWANVGYCQQGKRPSTRKTLLTKTTGVVELKNALKQDISTLSIHLLNAKWQKNCFQNISRKVPENSVVMHMDFSENYATFYQQEISSAHWMKNLVTVHPSVAYYTCPECGDEARPVIDVLVFLSNDNSHDHHAVQSFVETTVRFLKEERDVQFNHLYEFTDGCSSQYKSRGPFADISFGMTDFGIQRERYFFGSCHGKGPCDGAGGVVKTAARMAVIRGDAIITDAKTMYTYMKTKLTRKAKIQNVCNHSRREFFFIDVKWDRPDRTIKTSIKGTRKIHSVRGITPGIIQARNLVACAHIASLESGKHAPMPYVDAWNTHELQIPGAEGRRGIGTRTRGVHRGVRTRGVRGVARAPREAADQRGTGRRGTGGARTRGRGARRRGRGVRIRGGGRGGANIQNMSSEDSAMFVPGSTDTEDSTKDSDTDWFTGPQTVHFPLLASDAMMAQKSMHSKPDDGGAEKANDDVALSEDSFSSNILDISGSLSALNDDTALSVDTDLFTDPHAVHFPLLASDAMVAQESMQSTPDDGGAEKANDDVALSEDSFSSNILDISGSLSALIDSLIEDDDVDNSTMDIIISTCAANTDVAHEAQGNLQPENDTTRAKNPRKFSGNSKDIPGEKSWEIHRILLVLLPGEYQGRYWNRIFPGNLGIFYPGNFLLTRG